MTARNHPLEHEELMAYLDGELPPGRAAEAAGHLESCAECRNLAADLQGVSRRLMEWQVEAPGAANRAAIDAALEERKRRPVQKRFGAALFDVFILHPWRMAGIATATAVLVAAIIMPNLMRSPASLHEAAVKKSEPWTEAPNAPEQIRNRNEDALAAIPASAPANTPRKPAHPATRSSDAAKEKNGDIYSYDSLNQLAAVPSGVVQPGVVQPGVIQPRKAEGNADEAKAGAPAMRAAQARSPMIVHTAELSLVSRNFDQGRMEIEEILKRYGGYVGTLEVTAPPGSGRALNATLRVPAGRLQEMLTELKKLGRVTSESQSGEEVTQQYIDLEARLANARNTEQRLKELLRDRTGKLKDVLAVEKEIGDTRESIETMEAARKDMSNRVDYATLTLSLTEEYKAELQVVPVSTWTRIGNAAVEGYRNLVEGLIEVLLFAVSIGPSLLVWGLVLFFPARWTWRKFRQHGATV